MKKYVKSNISTEVHNMSKIELETVVSRIAYVIKDDSLSSSNRLVRVSSILSKFNLR